jgi:hypothetical protein
MEGRRAGTRGERSAAAYLAREAERMGLLPAGDSGTFFQRVPLELRSVRVTARGTGPRGAVRFAPGEIVPLPLDVAPLTSRTEDAGRVVFGGHVHDRELPADRRLALEDYSGAVLVIRGVPAPGQSWPTALPPIFDVPFLGRPNSPLKAVLLVAEGDLARQFNYRRDLAERGRIRVPSSMRPEDLPPVFLVSPEAASALLGMDVRELREPRKGFGTFSFSTVEDVRPVQAVNVVAALPGGDPLLRGSWVAAGAHYDHLGVGQSAEGDSVYNGADDNASGSAALLEAARNAAAVPANGRRRSLIFLWFSAEEAGMLGSEAYAARPTIPRDSIIAFLNLDMVGRNHADSLWVIGSRRLSTQLGDAVTAANARQPRPFRLDYSRDVVGHPDRSYCRSDHVSFARYGIPVVFFTTGHHAEYHLPSDEAPGVDYDKLARVTGLTADLLLDLANRSVRPTVDQPVPPLRAPCR